MLKNVKKILATVSFLLCATSVAAQTDPSLQNTPTKPTAVVQNTLQPTSNVQTTKETHPSDLFESFNRAMFGFNTFFAYHVVDPSAAGLDKVTPNWLRTAGSNFYENLTEPEFFFTNLIDGNFKDSAVSVARLVVNSTVGIAGIFDVATSLGLKRHQIEISDAFCNAGVPPGPYVVLPLVGSTNLLSGGLMGALLATEWYLLSLMDATIAAGDAILDTTVGAASLRHVGDVPASAQSDPYANQQNIYWNDLKKACPSPQTAKK